MNVKVELCQNWEDNRGNIVQFMNDSSFDGIDKSHCTINILQFKLRNVVRGNHYHKTTTEIFTLIQGRVRIKLVEIATLQEQEISLDSKEGAKRIFVSPGIAHAVESMTDNCLIVEYNNGKYEDRVDYQVIDSPITSSN